MKPQNKLYYVLLNRDILQVYFNGELGYILNYGRGYYYFSYNSNRHDWLLTIGWLIDGCK